MVWIGVISLGVQSPNRKSFSIRADRWDGRNPVLKCLEDLVGDVPNRELSSCPLHWINSWLNGANQILPSSSFHLDLFNKKTIDCFKKISKFSTYNFKKKYFCKLLKLVLRKPINSTRSNHLLRGSWELSHRQPFPFHFGSFQETHEVAWSSPNSKWS